MKNIVRMLLYPSMILLAVMTFSQCANAEEFKTVSYTQAEKDFMIQLAMCEDGANDSDSDEDGIVDGMAAIHQAVKNYCITYGKTIWQAKKDLQLKLYERPYRESEYQNSLNAFNAVWDDEKSVTTENIIWWVTPERYERSFHSTQKYVGQFGSHIFVAPHEQ